MSGPTPRRSVPLWRQRGYQVGGGVIAVVLLAVAVAFTLGGGGDGDGSGPTSDAGTPTTGDAPTTGTTAPAAIAPLTGMPAGIEVLSRAVIAVKVDNVNLAKRPPQAGIDVADVVYEEPVEGATRFVAIFHSTAPPRVGPVRSTRFVDPGIVWSIGGLYVYSGGTPPKVAAIKDSPVQTVDENGMQASGARIRDPEIPKPHNLFVVPAQLWAWTEVRDHNPPAPLFLFRAEGEAFPGDPASVVDIPGYSKPRYTWDATMSRWKREELLNGSATVQPHLAESGDQIAPANVIVQKISGTDDKSAMVGEGEAWIFSGGRVVRGRWMRPSLETRTSFVDATGIEVELAPGPTWITLITSDEPVITPDS